MERVYNFAPGPSALALPVLEKAQKELLTYCQRMIRESFMANFHQKQMSYMNLEEQNFTSRFAPFVNEGNAMGIMQELSEAQIHIEQNVNAKMVFFDLALKMIVLLIKK